MISTRQIHDDRIVAYCRLMLRDQYIIRQA